jgi:putative DNA-invertase from lambdoid prophage Rac
MTTAPVNMQGLGVSDMLALYGCPFQHGAAMNATFAYLRVSKDDDVMTTANQRLELEQAGHRIDYWHEDTISGSSPAMSRPGFAAMLAKMRDGETLVVSKLDRLGRDAMDVMSTVRALSARSIRVIVHALGGVDLTSTTGKLLVTMLAAVAEMERDLLIERTRAGVARAKAQGKHIGRPSKTTPNQREQIRVLLAQGSSVSSVARDFGISRAAVIALRKAQEGPWSRPEPSTVAVPLAGSAAPLAVS